MDDSHTNPTPATEAAPSSSQDVDSSEKASENASPAVEVATTVPDTQSWPSPDSSKAAMLHYWMKWSIMAQTHLEENLAALIAFWALSTWFQDALTVIPCLVITGASHDAIVVLRVLEVICREPLLAAEFRRGDLDNHRWNCQTLLILEPNLDNNKAALLGNLTNSGFRIVADGRRLDCSKSRAIYIGEGPATHKIQNSIHINIAPTNAEPPPTPAWLQATLNNLPSHLHNYRHKNLEEVRRLEFSPSGLPGETAAIAKALGSCIVDASELRQKLVVLLKTQDRQQVSQRSGTIDAVLVEAVLALSRQERKHAFTSEIADETNRLLGLRGERLKPETVGRQLGKLGLRTHRLTFAGNGLTFDKATLAVILRLAAMYVEEDRLVGAENLHSSQPAENKAVEEVM